MTFPTLAVFLPAVLMGILSVHLLWMDTDFKALLVKAFLGIGIGLGMASLLDFVYMLLFSNESGFLFVQLIFVFILLAAVLRRGRKSFSMTLPNLRPSPLQTILMAAAGFMLVLAVLSVFSIWSRRPHGAWDAWMNFNRSARFIYRDQADWRLSFSPQMDPLFHADYPLLIPLNIAWGWEAVGGETQRVPILHGGLFLLACAGLFVSSLAMTRSFGQACIGLIFLLGTPAFVTTGSLQIGDIPLGFFFIATASLILLYGRLRQPGLLALAGFCAGLAAWTKNEGILFLLVSLPALLLAFLRQRPFRVLGGYLLGSVLPLTAVLYFKIFLAPPGDVLSSGLARSIRQVLDPSRHATILKAFGNEILTFGGWGIGLFLVVLIYMSIFNFDLEKELRPAHITVLVIIVLQVIGYYGIFLITPYPLEWHILFSLERLIFQIYLLLLLLGLSACTEVEKIWNTR